MLAANQAGKSPKIMLKTVVIIIEPIISHKGINIDIGIPIMSAKINNPMDPNSTPPMDPKKPIRPASSDILMSN